MQHVLADLFAYVRANSMAYSQIPYCKEQGIFYGKQRICFGKQGISFRN